MDTKINEETKPEMSNALSVQKSSCITEPSPGVRRNPEREELGGPFGYLVENHTKKNWPINLSGKEQWYSCLFCRGAEEEVNCCIYKVLLGKVHYRCSEQDAWFLELFGFLVEEPCQSKAEFKLFYRIYSLAITCSAFNSPCVQLVSSFTKNALF